MRYLALYGFTLLVFLAIDFLWLGAVARGFYSDQLGHLLRPSVRWEAAFLFYLIFVAGLLHFVVLPELRDGSLVRAVLRGGFFGLVAYATYDLTNLATMRGFPALVVVVDMAWGFVLAAAVSTAAFLIGGRIFGLDSGI